MKYLLDTNACIEYLNNKKSPVAIRLAAQSPDDVALCSVVKAELYFGAARCRSPETAFEKVSTFVSGFESFPFDDTAAQTSAALRASWQQPARLSARTTCRSQPLPWRVGLCWSHITPVSLPVSKG